MKMMDEVDEVDGVGLENMAEVSEMEGVVDRVEEDAVLESEGVDIGPDPTGTRTVSVGCEGFTIEKERDVDAKAVVKSPPPIVIITVVAEAVSLSSTVETTIVVKASTVVGGTVIVFVTVSA